MDLTKFGENKEAEAVKDTVSMGSYIQESDALEWVINFAYLSESAKGAMALNLHLTQDGVKYRETIYFTNREKKTTYSRDGKVYSLPGFNTVNHLCLIAGGAPLAQLTVEKITVPLWNKDAGKEVLTEVESIKELSGEKAIFAIMKNLEDKNKLNEATGKYEATGETRETNSIDKVFRVTDKCTVTEIMAGETEGKFIDVWLGKNKGTVNNKVKGASTNGGTVSQGMPGAAPAASAPAKSLFSK